MQQFTCHLPSRLPQNSICATGLTELIEAPPIVVLDFLLSRRILRTQLAVSAQEREALPTLAASTLLYNFTYLGNLIVPVVRLAVQCSSKVCLRNQEA